MFSMYNDELPSSTTLVSMGEKKHVSKLSRMDTDTANRAMTDWRAQALSLETKRDNSSFLLRRLVGWLRRAMPQSTSPESYEFQCHPPAPIQSSGLSFGKTSC